MLLPDDDFDARVRIAQAECHPQGPICASDHRRASHLPDGTVTRYTSVNSRMANGRQAQAGRRNRGSYFRKAQEWPKTGLPPSG
jgi:hypothetical protein